jgi:hypothetical protein
VEVVDFDAGAPGVQILPGSFPGSDATGDVLANDAGGGTIDYHYDLTGADEVSGNGTVATVLFEAIGNGDANLAWSVRTLRDGAGVATTASAATATILVGNQAPPPTATNTPVNTPVATATSASTNTPFPSATGAATGTATRTPTPTGTVTATRTPAVTATMGATSTPRITVLENTNVGTATPRPANNAVNPAQTDRANGLPSAGNDEPGVIWWRWWFFGAVLLVGVAGWFFTFAVHFGDKDVVLMDRFDTRRRRHRRP